MTTLVPAIFPSADQDSFPENRYACFQNDAAHDVSMTLHLPAQCIRREPSERN